MEPNKLIVTIDQFTKLYPWPSKGSLYEMNRLRQKNGMDAAFLNYGRRVLVDVNKFFDCIKEINEKRKKK